MARRSALRRTYPLTILCAALALAASGCSGDDPSGSEVGPTSAGTEGEPISIGLVTDLSGRFVSFGKDIEAATNLAVERINADGGVNGSMLELVVEDTGGEPEQAVTAVRDLAEDGVFAISGPLSSGEAETVYAQAAQVMVPIMSGTANKDGITELGEGWTFLNQATNTALYTEALPAWMEEYGVSTAALVYDAEEPVSAGAAMGAIPAVAADVGLEIVNADSPITFTRGQTDFATTVQVIGETDADGLIIMSAPTEAGLIAAELARQGETRPIIGHPSQGSQSFFEGGGQEITDWMLPLIFDRDSTEPEVQEFVSAMNEVIAAPPLVAESANYYDSIFMLAEVMRDADINGSTPVEEARETIRAGLLDLSDFPGVTGTISFAGNAEATKTIHLVVVQNGEPTPL